MKHARIAWGGAVHHAIERAGELELQGPLTSMPEA